VDPPTNQAHNAWIVLLSKEQKGKKHIGYILDTVVDNKEQPQAHDGLLPYQLTRY
jgi:hypothetical protein